MLFNSFPFIFGFLPLALIVFYGVSRVSRRTGQAALALLSLGFYAWWRPSQLWILLVSILFNYFLGRRIQVDRAAGRLELVRSIMWVGVAADLAMLVYFKYLLFIVDNVSSVFEARIDHGTILLPLGISFFTFQKIAYLVDSARGDAEKTSFLDFSLFAAFFPQLIAGPIVHYKEVIPQFHAPSFGRLQARNLLIGLVIVANGLFKKTVLADSIGGYLDPLMLAAARHGHVDLLTGWTIAVSFTFQVYFDFSGYSDIAIGLARMLGILLPLNFHSPLRAASIIDYWRRWHMTLQRFILTYLFQPLSLPFNRLASRLRLEGWAAFAVGIGIPTFVTFFVLGIWHGAGWTFVVFGLLQAVYTCSNEAWRERRKRRRRAARRAGLTVGPPNFAARATYHVLTIVCVLVANTMFRAVTVSDGARLWSGMAGLGGVAREPAYAALSSPLLYALLALSAGIVFLMPNTQQLLGAFRPAINWGLWRSEDRAPLPWRWRPTPAGLGFTSIALCLGIIFIQKSEAIFIYFNF